MSEQTTEPTAFSHAAPWLHLRPGMRVVAFKDPEDFSVNGELVSVGVEGCAVRNLEDNAAPDDIFFATWRSGITFYPDAADVRHSQGGAA